MTECETLYKDFPASQAYFACFVPSGAHLQVRFRR
jgi:hypothetical protein